MKPTFEGTVDILVKAYFNDTLKHDDCYACAVGNIVYHSVGEFKAMVCCPSLDLDGVGWASVFCTSNKKQRIYQQNYKDEAKRQIDATGYSWEELAKIEFAFESSHFGDDEDTRMFNGLMAVVDVLADIHKIDLKSKEEAKLLFVKP